MGLVKPKTYIAFAKQEENMQVALGTIPWLLWGYI